MNMGDWTTIIVAIIAASPGLVALYKNRKKNEADSGKVKAETELIHAQVADRWAEHVEELMERVENLEAQSKADKALICALQVERDADKAEIKGLRLDIAQVRRASEEYRAENEDLKDWAERLNCQFRKHLPDIEPEKFIRRPEKESHCPHTLE